MQPIGRRVRIFLLEDHHVVRRGIAELLNAEPGFEVVGEAGTVAEALLSIPATRPDLAVLDARLPDGSGIDVCREIRSTLPETRCLILTSYHDPDAVQAAAQAGASGYLLKQVPSTGLIDAIRHTAAGRSLPDAVHTAPTVEQPPTVAPALVRVAGLTRREREVLELLAAGLSNRQVGARLGIAEGTAKNHVANLLRKLGLQHRTQAALLAVQLHDRATGPEAPAT